MVYDPYVLLNLFCYFFENFFIYIHRKYWPIIFLGGVSLGFWYQGTDGLIEWIWEYSMLFNFLERISISSSLNVWLNLPVKPSGPGLLFVGSFFFCRFRAFVAHEGSQAGGRIGAAAASRRHSHSILGSESHLWPTPQLMAAPDPWPAERGQGSNLCPHGS